MSSIVAVVGDVQDGRTGGEQYDARLLEAAKTAGFQVYHLTWADAISDALLRLPVLWRVAHVWRSLRLTFSLWRTSGDVLIDVWAAPYLQLWAKHTSRNIVLMVHHLRGELEQDKHIQASEAALIRAASRILTVSQSSKRQILQYLAQSPKQNTPIDVIPPGFARPKVMPKKKQRSDTVQLLFVGHITKAKGILDVLNAMAKLADDNFFLHVVGGASAEPETWQQAQALIAQHGLSGKVKMYGRVGHEQLQALYADADVFVLPSYWEGYGIVFLEAMYVGLPVVATTAGAIPEVVTHEKNGLLVHAGDVQGLSEALHTLIVQPELREKFAEHAWQAAKHAADWGQIEQKFVAWWQARAQDV
jgi:glycosyltransferase involved in cell wall biosynthesis